MSSELEVPAPAGNSRLLQAGAAAVTFVLSLALYLRTVAPTVTLVDSGELIVAARTLGVAHPPGFPLWVLLSHVATKLPSGSIAYRVHLSSALFAALAAALVTLAAWEILSAARGRGAKMPASASPVRRKSKRGESAASPAPAAGGEEEWIWASRFIPAVVAGLLLACGRTLWAYATIAEVYALNTALMIAIILMMLRWRSLRLAAMERGDRKPAGEDRWLYAAAFAFGLSLGVHHVTMAMAVIGVSAIVVGTEGWKFVATRRMLLSALSACAGLIAIYSYLPIAASRSPLMNWGDPETLQRIWWHISGRQYHVYLQFASGTMGPQIADMFRLVAREFGPVWVPAVLLLSIAGLVRLKRSDPACFWMLMLIALADMVYGWNYDIAEDKNAYYLPLMVVLVLTAAAGAKWAVEKVRGAAAAGVAAGLLVLPIIAVLFNWGVRDRSDFYIASDYVHNIFKTAEPNGLILTMDWQVYSPAIYFTDVEKERPDLVIVDINLLRRSWYFDYLRQRYPAVMARVAPTVDGFLALLRRWEQNPDEVQSSLQLATELNSRFDAVVLAFIQAHEAVGPIYATYEFPFSQDPRDQALTAKIKNDFALVPQGLLLQFFADKRGRPVTGERLETRGLADGTLAFESGDVVLTKVLPSYKYMYLIRGNYLAQFGNRAGAAEAYRDALELDPQFEEARKSLELVQAR